MHVDLLHPSNYLKAGELQGRDCTVVVKRLEPKHKLKGSDGKEESRPLLHFEGTWKPLVLNKTNARSIAKLWGTETNDWTGKPITIYCARVSAFGEEKDAVRVRPEKPKARGKKAETEQEATEPAHDAQTGEVAQDWSQVGPPPMDPGSDG